MPETGPKKLDLNRREMPKQTAEIRRQNFAEVALGYSADLAMEEARRCLQCKKRFCVINCPVQIDIPDFIQAIARGDFDQGARILKSKNALPSVCGRVCPQEEQCEKDCALVHKGAPVAIGRLERFLGDWSALQTETVAPARPAASGRSVAVVGGGPAGLTTAADLIQAGHRVVVFEALHKMGGVLSYGIPEFRLPKKIVDREIAALAQMGVEMRVDSVIGKLRSVDELLAEFDAVFIGTGAGLPWFMEIPGNHLNGVYSANEYLTRINLMKGYQFPRTATPIQPHQRVAVLGGGNVAMDCARTALRLGAHAAILYRRSRAELPARLEEVENAEEEGVEFRYLTLPLRVIGSPEGRVEGLECIRMELGQPDSSGRRSPAPVVGSEHFLPFDSVIHAIGNSPNPLIPATTPGLTQGRHGNLQVDPDTCMTSKERVWAGGDIATGAATVILAMGAGRKAAVSIHRYLSEPTAWPMINAGAVFTGTQ